MGIPLLSFLSEPIGGIRRVPFGAGRPFVLTPLITDPGRNGNSHGTEMADESVAVRKAHVGRELSELGWTRMGLAQQHADEARPDVLTPSLVRAELGECSLGRKV